MWGVGAVMEGSGGRRSRRRRGLCYGGRRTGVEPTPVVVVVMAAVQRGGGGGERDREEKKEGRGRKMVMSWWVGPNGNVSFSYSNSESTPNQMRMSACKIGALIQLIGALNDLPEERAILMKLLYFDDATPVGYEPPCFRGCTEEEVNNPWTKNPLKVKVVKVNSKHLVFALEVKSVLYQDDSDIQDVNVSLGAGYLKTELQVMENGRTNENGSFKGESSSQSKRSRKASAVEEPIIHYKCQKAQVA